MSKILNRFFFEKLWIWGRESVKFAILDMVGERKERGGDLLSLDGMVV